MKENGKERRVIRSPGVREFQALRVGETLIFGGKGPALSSAIAKLRKKLGPDEPVRTFKQKKCLVVLENDVFSAILVQRTK